MMFHKPLWLGVILASTLSFSACRKSCDAKVPPPLLDQFELYSEYPPSFERAWVMSSVWHGYMGVAIAVNGTEYFYWMYSDVHPFNWGPYRGQVTITGTTLTLEPQKQENPDEDSSLYATDWIIADSSASRIYSVEDGAESKRKHLILDHFFDPRHPFKNQKSLHP